MKGAHVLITGGAGFIGTALAARLADDNHVRVLDILRRNALSKAGLDRHPNVELVVGDVRDMTAVRRAVTGCDYVIHMASIAGVAPPLSRNPLIKFSRVRTPCSCPDPSTIGNSCCVV